MMKSKKWIYIPTIIVTLVVVLLLFSFDKIFPITNSGTTTTTAATTATIKDEPTATTTTTVDEMNMTGDETTGTTTTATETSQDKTETTTQGGSASSTESTTKETSVTTTTKVETTKKPTTTTTKKPTTTTTKKPTTTATTQADANLPYIDPRVEIGTARYGTEPLYSLGNCRVYDKRTWGARPSIVVYNDNCMRVTYYNRQNEKVVFDVEYPGEDLINRFVILDDGTYVGQYIGSYS